MEYGVDTARQYANYRPPLHGRLLRQCLTGRFSCGLDVGCGTGHSARALKEICDRVEALDPSAAMLRQAVAESGINYRLQEGRPLAYADGTFDVVTFAGSLYYARSQSLLDEVVRTSRPGARIVVYDFTAPLRTHCGELLGLKGVEALPEDYDATTTFEGLDTVAIRKLTTAAGTWDLKVDNPLALTALYLSDPPLAERLRKRFGGGEEVAQNVGVGLAKWMEAAKARPVVTFSTYTTVYEVAG